MSHPASRIAEALDRVIAIAKLSDELVGAAVQFIAKARAASRIVSPPLAGVYDRLIAACQSVRARAGAGLATASTYRVHYRGAGAITEVSGSDAVKIITGPLLLARDGLQVYDAMVNAMLEIASALTGNSLAIAEGLTDLITWLGKVVKTVARKVADAFDTIGSVGKWAIAGVLGIGALVLLTRGRDA